MSQGVHYLESPLYMDYTYTLLMSGAGMHVFNIATSAQKMHQKQSQKVTKFKKFLGEHTPRPPSLCALCTPYICYPPHFFTWPLQMWCPDIWRGIESVLCISACKRALKSTTQNIPQYGVQHSFLYTQCIVCDMLPVFYKPCISNHDQMWEIVEARIQLNILQVTVLLCCQYLLSLKLYSICKWGSGPVDSWSFSTLTPH